MSVDGERILQLQIRCSGMFSHGRLNESKDLHRVKE